MPRSSVYKAKDKDNIKTYEQKAILLSMDLYGQRYLVIFLWFVWASIHCDLKLNIQFYKKTQDQKPKRKQKLRYESTKMIVK